MQINNISKGNRVKAKESSGSKKKAAPGFLDLLTGQLEPTAETAPTTGTKAAGAATETAKVPAELRLRGLHASEDTIDMLESFARGLADLDLDADALQPLVEALEDGTTTLLDIREQLPADDPLAVLIDRVTTVSYIETEKYRRGDYS